MPGHRSRPLKTDRFSVACLAHGFDLSVEHIENKNFILPSSRNNEEGFPIPELPGKIHQLEDGDAIVFDENGQVKLLKK